MRFIHLSLLGILHAHSTSLKANSATAEKGVGPDVEVDFEYREVNSKRLAIPDYDDIIKDYENPFRDSGLLIAQNPDGTPAYGLLPSFVVEKKMCFVDAASDFKTWIKLKLVSTVHGLTAGSVKIGDEKPSSQFIHILPESDFIHLPPKAFEKIATPVGLNGKELKGKPWQFKKALLKELPNIEIQFAQTSLLFTLTPQAYTRCEEEGDSCILLVKLGSFEKSGFWFLGRPFFDYVVASISLGNAREGHYYICAPKLTEKQMESWPIRFSRTKVKVGMPWTPNDYVIMAMIVVFVIGLVMWMLRHKLTCLKRGQQASNVQTASLVPENQSVNAETPILTNAN
jgi:hypothetical protein